MQPQTARTSGGYCTCKTKASCELLGGYFMGTTCQEELGYWYPGVHEAVKEALDKQTCQGVEGTLGRHQVQRGHDGICLLRLSKVCL